MVAAVKSSKAFSLIEVLVSIAILAICLVALMKIFGIVSINNLRTEIRNRMVTILSNHINDLTSSDFVGIKTGITAIKGETRIRSFQLPYMIVDNITQKSLDFSESEKIIDSTISWQFDGERFAYKMSTVVIK